MSLIWYLMLVLPGSILLSVTLCSCAEKLGRIYRAYGRYAIPWWLMYREWPGEIEVRFLRGVGWGRYDAPKMVHGGPVAGGVASARPQRGVSGTRALEDAKVKAYGASRGQHALSSRIALGRHYWEGHRITACYFDPGPVVYHLTLDTLEKVRVHPETLENPHVLNSMYEQPYEEALTTAQTSNKPH